MPNFDGTGPNGKGPRTGRGMGICDENGKIDPTNANNQNRPRRGMGQNRKLDGTGPNGRGPKTGRGLGICDENGNIKKDN